MMKPVLFAIFFFSLSLFAVAQNELMVKSNDKGLYLEHRVAPKEGLYSIGRMYNVNPKHIAAFNRMDLNKGLNIDEVINIPLTDTNFTQKSAKGIPVHYKVAAGDVLSKISAVNRKVPIQNLRTWNKLSNDNIAEGKDLVIGFLVSKGMTSAPVTRPKEEIAITKPVEEKPLVKTEPVKEQVPEIIRPAATEEKPIGKEDKPVVREEARKAEPAYTKGDVSETASGQGYFKSSFEQQIKSNPASKNTTVTSGIFKTNSGWQDGKYYLLVDEVPTGSIVKLTNPDNNRVIYAKALGEMNGIRQNEGLGIRISTAAASALGMGEGEKFILKMNH